MFFKIFHQISENYYFGEAAPGDNQGSGLKNRFPQKKMSPSGLGNKIIKLCVEQKKGDN